MDTHFRPSPGLKSHQYYGTKPLAAREQCTKPIDHLGKLLLMTIKFRPSVRCDLIY